MSDHDLNEYINKNSYKISAEINRQANGNWKCKVSELEVDLRKYPIFDDYAYRIKSSKTYKLPSSCTFNEVLEKTFKTPALQEFNSEPIPCLEKLNELMSNNTADKNHYEKASLIMQIGKNKTKSFFYTNSCLSSVVKAPKINLALQKLDNYIESYEYYKTESETKIASDEEIEEFENN